MTFKFLDIQLLLSLTINLCMRKKKWNKLLEIINIYSLRKRIQLVNKYNNIYIKNT